MFQLHIWSKSLKSICGGFHLFKVEKKKKKKLRNFRPAYFFKECLPLQVKGTVQFLLGRHFHEFFLPFFLLFYSKQARKQLGGGGGPPCSFLKIEKKCSDFGKSTLTVRIYRLSFSFYLSFSILRVLRGLTSNFFPVRPHFREL